MQRSHIHLSRTLVRGSSTSTRQHSHRLRRSVSSSSSSHSSMVRDDIEGGSLLDQAHAGLHMLDLTGLNSKQGRRLCQSDPTTTTNEGKTAKPILHMRLRCCLLSNPERLFGRFAGYALRLVRAVDRTRSSVNKPSHISAVAGFALAHRSGNIPLLISRLSLDKTAKGSAAKRRPCALGRVEVSRLNFRHSAKPSKIKGLPGRSGRSGPTDGTGSLSLSHGMRLRGYRL